MKRDYIDFQDRSAPIAYLITIRTYGTWLHGDARFSMDRRAFNNYGGPKIAPNKGLERNEISLLRSKPVILDSNMRTMVESSIREVCDARGYGLAALNVRTNHVHAVTSGNRSPEFIMGSFKSYSTRRLRTEGLVPKNTKIWSRHGSTRYLWEDSHIDAAVEYVVNGQGGDLPSFD